MAELNIPNLNMNSDKYIFKKKLTLRRKSKRRLLIESTIMFSLSLFIVYINYLIPQKNLLVQNLPKALKNSFELFIELSSNLVEVFLVIFIIISLITALILLVGSFYRIFRVLNRKTKQINYK